MFGTLIAKKYLWFTVLANISVLRCSNFDAVTAQFDGQVELSYFVENIYFVYHSISYIEYSVIHHGFAIILKSKFSLAKSSDKRNIFRPILWTEKSG